MTVAAASATAVFVPAGAWRDPAGYTKGRATTELANEINNASVQAAVQFSNSEDGANPVTVAIGQEMTGNGFFPPPTTPGALTTNADTYRYMRLGWLVKWTSGPNVAYAAVGGYAELWGD